MEKVKLSDICNPKQWKTIPTSELLEDGYPVYGANGIIGYYSEYNHEVPVVTVTCRGATCGTINVTVPKSYVTGNAMCLDDVREDIEVEYLYYCLLQYDFSNVISGSAQPQITRQGLDKVYLNIGSHTEQVKIVDRLKRIENIVNLRKKELQNLDGLIKARFVELVRDNITTATKLKFVVEDERIITYGIVKPGEHTVGGVPIIKVKDFPNGVILLDDLLLASREIESKYKRSRVKEGDLLFSIRGSVGRTAFVPKELVDANITQDTARISISKDYNPHYVRTALEYDTVQQSIREHVRGVAVKGISLAELREIEIPVVEKVLQDAFGRFIEQTDKSKVVFYI